MRHSNSFTHEPLWAVTHTAWHMTEQTLKKAKYLKATQLLSR